jgi:hypothetical protein
VAGPPGREQDRRRFRRRLCKSRSTRRRRQAGGALHEPTGCPHRDSAQSVLAAMADEHARIDPLPAAVDTAFASSAQDRLADVSDALATTLTSHLAHEETDALP